MSAGFLGQFRTLGRFRATIFPNGGVFDVVVRDLSVMVAHECFDTLEAAEQFAEDALRFWSGGAS